MKSLDLVIDFTLQITNPSNVTFSLGWECVKLKRFDKQVFIAI